MAAPVIRKEGQSFTTGQQAAMYFARKRRRARSEGTPALRASNSQVGVRMNVSLSAA